MIKDNRTIEEIQKNILLLQEQTEAIKKETEAIKKESEAVKRKGEEELNALKKDGEVRHQKHIDEMEAIKKKGEEELNALKKDGEARHQKHIDEMEAIKKKGEEELNALKKDGEARHQKHIDEMKAIKKAGEARHQKHIDEMEAIKKAGEARHQKYLDEMEVLRLVEKDDTNKLRKTLKDLGKQMYNMGINIGFGVEESIYNALDLYKRLDGIDYDKIYKNNVYKDFKTGLTKGESDIILLNGHHAAIVEVKHRLTINHIRDFYTKKMPLFMEYEQKFEGKKVHIYFACESFENDVIKEATNKGCGLIEPRYNDIASIVKAS